MVKFPPPSDDVVPTVTLTAPEGSEGMVTVILVVLLMVYLPEATTCAPNFTVETMGVPFVSKCFPLITTLVPPVVDPDVGVTDVTWGSVVTNV